MLPDVGISEGIDAIQLAPLMADRRENIERKRRAPVCLRSLCQICCDFEDLIEKFEKVKQFHYPVLSLCFNHFIRILIYSLIPFNKVLTLFELLTNNYNLSISSAIQN